MHRQPTLANIMPGPAQQPSDVRLDAEMLARALSLGHWCRYLGPEGVVRPGQAPRPSRLEPRTGCWTGPPFAPYGYHPFPPTRAGGRTICATLSRGVWGGRLQQLLTGCCSTCTGWPDTTPCSRG